METSETRSPRDLTDAVRGEVGGPDFLTGIPWSETARTGPGCNCHWAVAPNPLRIQQRCACMCPIHGNAEPTTISEAIPANG